MNEHDDISQVERVGCQRDYLLKEFLFENGTDEQLVALIMQLADSARNIRKGFLQKATGRRLEEKSYNMFDEKQMALDVYANEVLVNGLRKTRLARYVSTEEERGIIEIDEPKNNYGVVMDPLDGSSLIGINLAVGTIVGIYPGHVLEKGSKMVASLYFIYGPLTTLTLTVGKGVHEFVLNEAGQFVLSIRDLLIPDGKIYSPGALRSEYFPSHEKWISYLEKDSYKLRFSGCFASDVHQILHKGGVFSYPGYQGNEKGKLRILFEANPMGKIIVEAGGAISDGKVNILDIRPSSITDTTPVYIGGKKEIALIQQIWKMNIDPPSSQE